MSLQRADRLLSPAVDSTVASLSLVDADLAVARLAGVYAGAIDEARRGEAWADGVLAKLDAESPLTEEIRAIRAKLAAKVVLADLGPKLQAALVELGATPKTRAALHRPEPAAPAGSPRASSPLQVVRENVRRRSPGA